MDKSEKRVGKSRLLRRLWGYMRRFRGLLLLAAFMAVAGNLLSLLGPTLSGKAIDAIGTGRGETDFETVFRCAGLMLLFFMLSSAMSYLLSLLMIKISRSVVLEMRKDIFSKLSAMPVSFFDKHLTGDILSIISYDVDTVNASLSTDLIQICTSVITVVGSLIMMLSIEPRLVLVFAVTIPTSLWFTRFRAKKVRPLFRKRSVMLGELNGYVEEIIGGQKTSKAYGREQIMLERFDVKNEQAVDAYYDADYYASIAGPSVNFINNISLALVSVFGALLYLGGAMSIGSISSFVLYSRKFSGPINEFANIISELQSAFSAAERIFRLIDEPPEAPDAPGARVLENVSGEVRLENVSFGYDEGVTILKELDLLAETGKTVAIVGPTGAGKTTVINLLMRFYDVDSGAIFVDGNNIGQLTRSSLRSAYSMVLQDTWLFHGTVYENLAYGRAGVTREQVEQAAKAARIHGFICKLPDGYDTLISDNGVNISKGQKQLMTIARAMLLDSKMLILDEATSNVDTGTERRIQSAMRELMRGKTCFIIAHRLSTVQNADLILVMDRGEIVERGTHDELMSRDGLYSRLYMSQFD